MKSAEHGRGTVATIRDRETHEVVGYQAKLPRHLSTPPRGVKKGRYQETVGPVQETHEAARSLLDAAIKNVRDQRARGAFEHGLPFSEYVAAAIKAKTTDARRECGNDARANKMTSTWRSIDRCWLADADFYTLPPSVIVAADLQRFIDFLCDEAEGRSGEPLSHAFIGNVARLIREALDRAGGPNQARLLELPEKSKPRVRYLELSQQRGFCGAEKVPLRDRVQVGCGMGAGLRIGELLAMEAVDVHLDDHDPHLVVRYGGPHQAPTKGKLVRRVELYEPGLGFWKLWMQRFYAGGRRVFQGPEGGYMKAWPEQFPSWAKFASVDRLTSHAMRHSYAVALLSGTWGYEPRSLEFVSKQLGHADVQTTERYYGAFEFGVWQREVRRMTGRDPERPRRPVTAAELLGLDASNDASGGPGPLRLASGFDLGVVPRHPPNSLDSSTDPADLDAVAHQTDTALEAALESAARLDPHAARRLIDAAIEARATIAELRAALRKEGRRVG